MMKILYVEDNPANISLLQRIARMGGQQVINYTNGENALNNFDLDKPDLVLMDLQLEGRVSGLEVVKKLREQGFKTPIVAVTAYAMVGDRERCLEAGCDSYLSKPLPVAELVELVQRYELQFEESTVVKPELIKDTVDLPKTEELTEPSREPTRDLTSASRNNTRVDPAPSSGST
jgi:CheY-like chemotaxis protein